ncbi:TPA: hypothetical protein ACH3X2_003929 [Trebouxia sp. C0005]
MQALRGSPLSLTIRLPRPVCRGRYIVRGIAAPAPTTRVRYIKRPDEKELFIYTVPPPQEKDRVTNVDVDEVPMRLSDLRTANHMTLQQNGFELVSFPSGQGITWEDKEQVKNVYYPEVKSLIQRMTSASRVEIIQHNLRKGKIEKGQADLSKLPDTTGHPISHPSVLTHVDFTESSGPKVLERYFGAEAAAQLKQKPWAIIQVWRPLVGPVQDSALGFVDAATLSQHDILPANLFLTEEFAIEVNYIVHNSDHRWFWTSQMREDEAYVFVNYDSRHDGRARFTPHSTIVDPNVPEDAPIRQSIETRAFVFWDE